MDPVAKVGDTYYATLAEAFAAANASGGTVTVLKDVTVSEPLTVNAGSAIVLDLNGKTITGTDTTSSNFGLINNNGTLTVNDSVGGGKILLTATTNSGWGRYSAVISNNPGGTLYINGGSIEHRGGTDMAYGIDSLTNGNLGDVSVTVNDGSISSTYRAIRQFLNSDSNKNTLVINGGSVSGANRGVFFHDPSTKANKGAITIGDNAAVEGGVYLYVTEGSTSWPVQVSISGDAVGENGVVTANVPAGHELTTVNGNYTVVETDKPVRIGSEYYLTLAEAVAAAPDGATVELLEDITISDPLIVTKNLSIVGNGKTVTYSGTDRAITVEDSSPGVNLSISDLIVSAPNAQRGINYNTTGKLTLNKVNVTASTYAINLPGSSDGAIVDIDDCTLTANIALNIWGSNATITVDNSVLSCIDETDKESYSTIQLNNDGSISAEGTVVTVTGGSVSAQPDSSIVTNWTSTGKVIISDSTVTNGKPPLVIVANCGGYGYSTLQSAIAEREISNAKDDIVLLRDVTLSEDLVINKSVTIDPKGCNIVADGGKIVINDENAVLTIKGTYSDTQIAQFKADFTMADMCVHSGSIVVHKSHTGGTASCNKQAECVNCGQSYGSTPDHTPGTAATCTKQATCSVCTQSYGEFAPDNHALLYTGSGNTITESCENGCTHNATAKLELDISVSTAYTGAAITPLKVVYSDNWLAAEDLTISYTDNVNIGKAIGSIEKANTNANVSKAVATAQFDITRAAYTLTVNNYRYVRGSGYPLSFTSNVPYDVNNTVTKLLIYRANGTPVMEVPAAHFVLSANNSGMTVITLSPTVMNALDALNYELLATFTNGDAKGAFRVLLPFIFPMTGDDAPTVILLCVMFVALGTAGVTLFIMRRKNRGNRYHSRH